MSLASLLNNYLNLNLLIAMGFVTSLLFIPLFSKRLLLKLNYALLSAVLFLTLIQPFFPAKVFFEPLAKVWSGEFYREEANTVKTIHPHDAYLALSSAESNSWVDSKKAQTGFSLFLLLLFAVGCFKMARDLFLLYRIRQNSYQIRKIGTLHLYMNDRIRVPFSYRLFSQKNIVVPESLLSESRELNMIVRHELQHHRQLDTLWVYGVWFLKSICAANPFVYLWNRSISELQEFACDETLVGQLKVESHAYAGCLLKTAQTLVNPERSPICATGLSFLVSRNLLKRRIEMLFQGPKKLADLKVAIPLMFIVFTTMTFVTYASQDWVQDRRISMEQGQELLKTAGNSEFPLAMNESVLKELNHYAGTPEGRDFIKKSLQRKKQYSAMIEAKIKKHAAAPELIAIPIIESGFQNLAQTSNTALAAGLWMFIPSTATTYHLKIDEKVDERLDPAKETEAALRYLVGEKTAFSSWQLAALSYNWGGKNVKEMMAKTGSQDPWVLEQASAVKDKYLARLTALMIILKNPSLLQ